MAQSPLSLRSKLKPLINRISKSLPFSGRSILIATLVATTLISGAKKLGGLQRFELFIFDSLVRLKVDQGQDSRLIIVGITETDIQKYGHPFSDSEVANVLSIIQQNDPKVVGLDIYRKTEHPPGQDLLRKQLSKPNLIAITNVGTDPATGEVPPPEGVIWEQVGFNDFSIDPDGVIRRALLFVSSSDRPYYSFALRSALAYLPQNDTSFTYDQDALYINGQKIPRLEAKSGGYEHADNRGFQTLLRYRSRTSPAEIISADDVIEKRFDAAQFEGKIVLIGAVAPSLKDEFFTPYSASREYQFKMAGVVVHAQIISQLLDIAEGRSAQYTFLPPRGELLWLLSWAGLTSFLTWKIRRPEVLLLVGIVLSFGLFGLGWIALSELVWLPIFEPFVGMLATGALVIAQKSIYRTTYDSLTDLPGREVFLLNIQRALHNQKENPVVVAFLDIDRFQIISKMT